MVFIMGGGGAATTVTSRSEAQVGQVPTPNSAQPSTGRSNAISQVLANFGPNHSAYAELAAFATDQHYQILANSDLSDRIVVVVGAATDVVQATAIKLSAQGAQLVLLDAPHQHDRLVSLAAECDSEAKHGNKWHFRDNKWQRVQKAVVHTLQPNDDQHDKLASTLTNIVNSFGRIDALVFKAPQSSTMSTSCLVDPGVCDKLTQCLSSELMLLVRLIQLVLPHLQQSGGAIVNISTTVALHPKSTQLVSAMTRAAMDMMIKCICPVLGPKKIRINSVLHLQPTPLAPQTSLANGLEVNQSMMDQYLQQIEKDHIGQRLLRSNDVATAVLYLLSPRSSFLNGANLVVDGGKILMAQV